MKLGSLDAGTKQVAGDAPVGTRAGSRTLATWAGLLVLACIIVATAWVSWQRQYFVDAEMTLLPWLMQRDWALYRDAIDQHPPLLPGVLALVANAGDPGVPSQAFVIAVLCVTLLLTYALADRIAGPVAGVIAALFVSVWSLPFDGLHLWYDGALAPLYLGQSLLTFLFLARPVRNRLWPVFGTGLLGGFAVLVKQHAAVAVIGIACMFLWAGDERRGLRTLYLAFVAGLALPVLPAALWLSLQGASGDAWHWLVTYNLTGEYARAASQMPVPGEWPVLGALYAPLVAAILYWAYRVRMRPVNTAPPVPMSWIVGIGVVLVAATLPAWPRYGRYHFQAALPLLGVAAGVAGVGALVQAVRIAHAWSRRGEGWRTAVLGATLVLLATSFVVGGWQWAEAGKWQAFTGAPSAPFALTAPTVRAWVDGQAPPDTAIFLYDIDPLLYRVLEREPPRPWVPQLPWMLNGDTARRFWRGVQEVRPRVMLTSAVAWTRIRQGRPLVGEAPEIVAMMQEYREGNRFSIAAYGGAAPVEIIGLVRVDAPER